MHFSRRVGGSAQKAFLPNTLNGRSTYLLNFFRAFRLFRG